MSRVGWLMRAGGWGGLLVSLLGWSAWWVICNVYEFAPRLSSAALLCAWAAALLALGAGLLRRGGSGWLLAGFNGLYLLMVHQQLDSGAGPLAFALLLLAVVVAVLRVRHANKQPASLPAA